MNWRRTRDMTYVSDCGRFEMRGRWSKQGNFWNAWYTPANRHIAASSDKDFVKGRCEADAIFIDLMGLHTAKERAAA